MVERRTDREAMPSSSIELDYLPELPDDRSVRIGCIGSGFIMADCHLVAYRAAGLQPLAIASRHPEKAAKVATRHEIPKVYATYQALLADTDLQVIDIAVPPDCLLDVISEVVKHRHIRGVLAQKPLGCNYQQAEKIVHLCQDVGITLCVNQNMRYDQSVRACKSLLDQRVDGKPPLGRPVLATIDMRAIDPHPFVQRDIGPRDEARHRVWMRAAGRLPDDSVVHASMLAYMSDVSLLHPVLAKHGVSFSLDPIMGASLDLSLIHI